MDVNKKEEIKNEKLEKLKEISNEVIKIYGTENDKKKLKIGKDENESDEER